MISQIKRAFNASRYDVLLAGVSALGAILGVVFTHTRSPLEVAAGSATGTILLLGATVFTVHLVKPRYTIKDKRFKDIFIEKLVSDVNNFSDSNTSVLESNKRMLRDSETILHFANSYSMLEKELDELRLVRDWFKKGTTKEMSFVELMDRRGLSQVARLLAHQVKESITVPELKINTSIVEPGCVGLVEKMRELGLPIIHEFTDINGIEQARALASEVEYSSSFIPFSTVYLSKERIRIIERYKYLRPITWEEQMILGKRNVSGEFSIKRVSCPERGSGHYQLMTMMSNGDFGHSVDNPIDLGHFGDHENGYESLVLYQPIAEIYREVKGLSEHWGYIRSVPFPVDIITIVNEKHFGNGLASFQSLITILMAIMRSDLQKTLDFGNDLCKGEKYRSAFEDATNHFADIIKN